MTIDINEELVLSFNNFLSHHKDAEDRAELARFLTTTTPRAHLDVMWTPEQAEERIALGGAIEQEWEQRLPGMRLSQFHLAVIFALPIDALRRERAAAAAADVFGLQSLLDATERMVRLFLQMSEPGAGKRAPTPQASRSVNRDARQVEVCLERDGRGCVFLQTSDGEACHILPFAANSTSTSMWTLSSTLPVLKCILGNSAPLLLQDLGCTDKAWNMITLNRQLHKWWSQGKFGLKCLGIEPVRNAGATVEADIVLQFVWLPQRQAVPAESETRKKIPTTVARSDAWQQHIDLAAGEGSEWWHSWETQLTTGIFTRSHHTPAGRQTVTGAAMPMSGRQLRSGTTATLRMSPEDAGKMKVMIDLQWACLVIATMSGAAGSPAFLADDDDEDGDTSDISLGD